MAQAQLRMVFSRRNAPKLIALVLFLFFANSYWRCSPYLCSPKFSTRTDTGYSYHDTATHYRVKHGQDHVQVALDEDEHKSNVGTKATVVASMRNDDVSWLGEHISDWQHNVYVVDDPQAALTVATNKGRESMVYLTYLIDNYDDLPDYMVFLHSLRYQWHNEDPMYDGVPPLKNLQLPYVNQTGYANMRCTWSLGCPNEIKPAKALSALEAMTQPGNERANTEASFTQAYQELFSEEQVPAEVGIQCGAQFAVSRWKVRERPLRDYIKYREWLRNTPLADSVSGRILEYSWHIMMGFPAVFCPDAGECFCKKFGYCDLNCTEDRCEKRYQLPKYASIPHDWPEKGTGEDGFPADGWWL